MACRKRTEVPEEQAASNKPEWKLLSKIQDISLFPAKKADSLKGIGQAGQSLKYSEHITRTG
jgi:hypothetical protein